MDKRGGLNKDEAYKLASYLCNVASLGSEVVIEVFWSNPWLNRVLLPCFLQISKVLVHDDSLNFLYSPVIPCSQLSYSDHSPGPHYHDHRQMSNSKAIPRHFAGDSQGSIPHRLTLPSWFLELIQLLYSMVDARKQTEASSSNLQC